MSISPAVIFAKHQSLDEFIKEIRDYDGDFYFDKQDMIELCDVYFERYPDSVHHRNTEEVLIGYELFRTCILEKALEGFNGDVKTNVRTIIKNISSIDEKIEKCITLYGYTKTVSMHDSIFDKISKIKLTIDKLPMGMMKERYVGGITLFYNISYIVADALKKHKDD